MGSVDHSRLPCLSHTHTPAALPAASRLPFFAACCPLPGSASVGLVLLYCLKQYSEDLFWANLQSTWNMAVITLVIPGALKISPEQTAHFCCSTMHAGAVAARPALAASHAGSLTLSQPEIGAVTAGSIVQFGHAYDRSDCPGAK